MIMFKHNPIHYNSFKNKVLENKILTLLIIVFLVVLPELSYASSPNAVIIYGIVNNPSGETISIKIHTVNNSTDTSSIFLVGNSTIIHRDNSGLMLQYASFHVQSNMSTNTTVFDLAGNVITSSDPSMIGKPVLITANTSTRDMTLVFGYSNYTGTGTVLIK